MFSRLLQTLSFVIVASMIGATLYMRVDIIHRGGVLMIPILMCSVFAMAITFERLAYFLSSGAGAGHFFLELKSLSQKKRWNDAQMLCESSKGPIAKVALAGLSVRGASRSEMERSMEDAAHEELPLVERNQRWLSTIAQVSTLLGLLGTVAGMVVAFQTIQNKATSASPVNPADLAGGIWQALITTVAGLSVAIPTILAYNYLIGKVSEVQYQMECVAAIIANGAQKE